MEAAPDRDCGARVAARLGTPRGEAGGADVAMAIRPHPLYIVLRSLGALCWIAVLAVGMAWLSWTGVIGAAAGPFLLAGALGAGLVLLWRLADWWCRRYVLTGGGDGARGDGRVEASWGVVRRSSVEAPLSAIRTIVVHQSARERVFGLGSIGFATAATSGVEVVWRMVERPREVREAAREAIRRAGAGAEPGAGAAGVGRSGCMPVIGIAGGIGSGKSELARALEGLGCVVVDSDAEAKAALELPEVREQVRSWWGERAFDGEGRVDRKAVAGIVFGNEEARRQLEALVHPIVKARRAEKVAAARARGAAGVVIDAPLLFEAGVDAECDYIVFVEARREVRAERVAARGWAEEELARREGSQWDLAKKRASSDTVVKNEGSRADLEKAAPRILKDAASRARRGDAQGA